MIHSRAPNVTNIITKSLALELCEKVADFARTQAYPTRFPTFASQIRAERLKVCTTGRIGAVSEQDAQQSGPLLAV